MTGVAYLVTPGKFKPASFSNHLKFQRSDLTFLINNTSLSQNKSALVDIEKI